VRDRVTEDPGQYVPSPRLRRMFGADTEDAMRDPSHQRLNIPHFIRTHPWWIPRGGAGQGRSQRGKSTARTRDPRV